MAICLSGKRCPLFLMAARTRSFVSFKVVSGRPTIVNSGKPSVISTSTSTNTPSNPTRAQSCTIAIINIPLIRIVHLLCLSESKDSRWIVRGKRFDVRKLLIDDLRSVKRKDADKDGKKQINSKEEQKNILGGRSPEWEIPE